MKLSVSEAGLEEALRQELAKQGLTLVNLEGGGDTYAFYASNDANERVKGMLKRAGGGYEMEILPILDETADH